jgi:hypothetical protein
MFEGSNEKETSFACVIVGLMFKVRQRMLALTICYPPRLYRRFMLLCLSTYLHFDPLCTSPIVIAILYNCAYDMQYCTIKLRPPQTPSLIWAYFAEGFGLRPLRLGLLRPPSGQCPVDLPYFPTLL